MQSIKLTKRNQEQIENPTVSDIASALDELEKTDPEHPNTWLEYGFESGDDWSLIILDAYESGLVIFSFWQDQDDNDPLKQIRFNSSLKETKKLFGLLAQREIDTLKRIVKGTSD